MKWMDRPSATEMDEGSDYEMDRQTKCHKNGNATEVDNTLLYILVHVPKKLIKFYSFQWHFNFLALCLYIHFKSTSSIHFSGTWSVHPFHRHFI